MSVELAQSFFNPHYVEQIHCSMQRVMRHRPTLDLIDHKRLMRLLISATRVV